MIFDDRFDGIRFAVGQACIPGTYLEFGVYQGNSINFIADLIKPERVYGFDSFKGLPEDWERGDTVYKKGHFTLDKLPTVRDNVTLIEGFFNDSLAPWLLGNGSDISFLHIDVDLYSSTKCILESLDNKIVSGTIICFDEYCDWTDSGIYDKWEEGEYLAFKEWGRSADLIAKHGLFGAVFQVT